MPKLPSWRTTKGNPSAMRALVKEMKKTSEALLAPLGKKEITRLEWRIQKLREHATKEHGFDWEEVCRRAIIAKAAAGGKSAITPESLKARVEFLQGKLNTGDSNAGGRASFQAKKELTALMSHARENKIPLDEITWPNEFNPFAARAYVWRKKQGAR